MEDFEIFFVILIAIGTTIGGAWLQSRFDLFQVRQNRKEEKDESRKDLINSLLSEMDVNKKLFEKGLEHFPHYKFKGFWHSLRINRFTNTVSTERYDLLSPETKEVVSEYHEKAQRMNECVKKLESEQDILIAQKILHEQNDLLNDLVRISSKIKSLLESE